MASVGGLSVKVSASVAQFNTGMQRAQDAAQDLSLSLFRLGRSSSEAEGEIDSAGRSALTTAGSFSALTAGTNGLNLSFGVLGSTTMTVLVPALVALSTTLVPIAATLGAVAAAATGLAGAFGAIIGSGIIAFGAERGEQNQKRLNEVNARIASLEELREQEGQLTEAQQEELKSLEETSDKLEEQTGVMGGLKSVIADLRAELAPLIIEFGQQFTPLIESAISALPQLVRNILAAMGGMDRFTRALRNAGQAAFRVLPAMVSGLMDLAREALPQLINLGRWLINNGPRIFNSMVQTARNVGPALLSITQGVLSTLPAINRFGSFIINNIVPAFNKASATASRFAPELRALATEVKAMLPGLMQLGKRILSVVVPAGKAFIQILANIAGAFNSLNPQQKKIAISALAAAIGVLGGPVAAIGGAAVIAANHWDFFEGVINTVVDSLKTLHGWLVDIWETLTDNPIVNTLSNIGGAIGGGLGGMTVQESRLNPQMGPAGRQQTQTNVNVRLEGGDRLSQEMLNQAEVVVEEQDRRTRRNSATNAAPR